MSFQNSPDLRPSPDATRETLFNWLGHDLQSQNCLDLFAGSGALGFEAASRGATSVVMVESNRGTCEKIKENISLLQGDAAIRVMYMDVKRYLQTTQSYNLAQYNLVFMDPPFAQNLWQMTCDLLCENRLLASKAKIYVESADAVSPLLIDSSWHIMRACKRGLVHSTLIQT